MEEISILWIFKCFESQWERSVLFVFMSFVARSLSTKQLNKLRFISIRLKLKTVRNRPNVKFPRNFSTHHIVHGKGWWYICYSDTNDVSFHIRSDTSYDHYRTPRLRFQNLNIPDIHSDILGPSLYLFCTNHDSRTWYFHKDLEMFNSTKQT